jgi:3-methyladenine DNA glycosylase/8-oxoguanine DNA glycosylase
VSAPGAAQRELRVEVQPRWPFALPRFYGHDGLVRVRGGVLERLVHVGEQPVAVRVAVSAGGGVLFGARAADRPSGERAIARLRVALGVDHDLRAFHERFRHDPLIGAAVRRDPRLRVRGRPAPFEALAFAICEQLIDAERAGAIERRLIAGLGRRCSRTGLRDAPSAAALAVSAPARLRSFGLSEGRSLALRAASREVAAGRVDLDDPEHEPGWRRLRAIPGIGSWTIQCLALHGQGRLDQLPAGDLAYRKLVGRLRSGGDPYARAEEAEVAELFAPYAPWAGLAGAYALRGGCGRSSIVSASHGASASASRSAASLS